jgi:amidophosphoribosyltransferase
MAAASELIASKKTVDQIKEEIGADWLIYQDLEALMRAVSHDNSDITGFDTSCFSGEYITNDVSEKYLKKIESIRNDRAKQKKEADISQHTNISKADRIASI